jgi:hypothetical protein
VPADDRPDVGGIDEGVEEVVVLDARKAEQCVDAGGAQCRHHLLGDGA